MTNDSPVVLYHGNCSDGYTAAWVARRRYPAATLVACYYGDPLNEDLVRGRDVVLLDFSYNRHNMLILAGLARSVLVLDHHKSAQNELSNLETTASVQVFFDMERSGAQLAWEHFFPGVDTPELISYVADYDLYRLELPDSLLVNTALNSYKFSFETWDRFGVTGVAKLVAEGRAIQRYQDILVRSAIKAGISGTLQGYKVLVMNTEVKNETSASALAEGLCQVAVTWRQVAGGEYRYSLRSEKDGPDVAKIASAFGGGGHQQAAGFQSSRVIDFS